MYIYYVNVERNIRGDLDRGADLVGCVVCAEKNAGDKGSFVAVPFPMSVNVNITLERGSCRLLQPCDCVARLQRSESTGCLGCGGAECLSVVVSIYC